MKTKHLLFATALVASLAACTNDDFSFDKQQPVADGRPVVSDVKLNFTGEADTRLAFGKDGYAWEANDTIGALLMDNVKTLEEGKTWLEKYSLVGYIHTSYPFTYSAADQTWGCNTKMLEGNYFFAFPWESYEGQRKVRHLLTKQEQNGVKGSVVAESYAKNQFFIGYAQIKAGTNAKDALTDVHMTSLLGGVQLRIVNTGTQTYHINKIVLKGTGIQSELTFDPTNADYKVEGVDFNLSSEVGEDTFNYANYTDNKTDVYTKGGDYVFVEGEGYNREDALRAVVAASGDANSAQLIINGTSEERALVSTKDNAKAVAYALIMANAHKPSTGDLTLDIYTDEGMVSGIDLTKINTADGNKYLATTDSKVEEISPAVSNTIKVQIDDNSFAIPTEMDVFDGEDLLQFIKWNATVTGARTAKATLKKEVTLTKEMMDVLAKKENLKLTIDGTEKLTVAADVAANVLENAQLTISTEIEALGTVNLTKKTNKFKQGITVAEGATLNINTDEVALVKTVKNYGTLNIAESVTLKKENSGSIENYAVMNVAKLADVKATVTNMADATLNVDGFVIGLTNAEDATVVMGESGNLASVTNNGVIRTAKDAVVAGTNTNGEIVYVEGANIAATGGIISYETSGKSFGKDAFKENKVNKLILKKGITKITDNLSIATIEIAEDGVVLEVADKKTLTVTALNVKAVATTKGNIEAAKVVVEKEATLTNNGTITAEAFDNKGVVANNGHVYVPEDAVEALNATNWKYNEAEKKTTTKPEEKTEISLTVVVDADGTEGLGAADTDNNKTLTVNSLSSLYNFWNKKEGGVEQVEGESYTIAEITLSSAVAADTESDILKGTSTTEKYTNGELLAMFDGAAVKLNLGAELTNVKPSLALTFKELNVTAAATISGTVKNLTVLTADKITLGGALTITDSFVKLNEAGKNSVGTESIEKLTGGSMVASSTGKIVDKDLNFSYNVDDELWEAL